MSGASFEARYRADPDPWDTLTSPYERDKRARTLAACGPGPFAAACDLGAGPGVLAAELAPRCARLLALDAAPTAVAAARGRLTPFPHAEARVAALPGGLPAPGDPYDLIVAAEILYYLDEPALEATLAWADRALPAGGRLVAVHWTGTAGDLRRDAAAVGAALGALGGRHRVLAEDRFRLEVVER